MDDHCQKEKLTITSTNSSEDMPATLFSSRGLLRRYFSWKTESPPKWLVLLAPIALNIAFGFYPVVIKMITNGHTSTHQVNPFVFTFYRSLGAFPVLLLCSYFVEGPIPIPDLRMFGVFMVFGFTGMAGGQYFYILGAYILPADISSAFQPLIPVWTTFFALVLCTEKVPSILMLHTWAKILGVILAIGGAVRLALAGYEPDSTQTSVQVDQQALGYFCLIMETLLGALYYTLQKKLVYQVENYSWKEYPFALTGYAYLFGCVYQGIFCLYYIFSGQTEAFYLPQHSLPALVYAVFIVSAFCYFLVSWSNKYLPSSVMTAFWPVQVVTTTLTAYMLLGDTLTQTQMLAVLGIIAGLALVIYSNRMDEKIATSGEGGIRLDTCFNNHKSNSS